MLSATLYIIVCSARNRLRQRLRRLREPRYLVGALAGVGYLVFTLLIRQRAYSDRDDDPPRQPIASASLLGMAGPIVGGVLLAGAALGSWVVPVSSGLLEFSRAESAFLFASPMTRRQLVIYRLMRSQFAVFTGALIMALAYPTGTLFTRIRSLVGLWILLMTSHVFFTGVVLARARRSASASATRAFWPALLLPGAAVLSVLVPLLLHAASTPIETVWDAIDLATVTARQGVARIVLMPFTVLTAPLFAPTVVDFARALAGAVLIYGVAVAWLVHVDSLSPEAADASVERQVNEPLRPARRYTARPVRWMPGHRAPPEMLFVWKNVLQTLRTVDRRLIVRLAIVITWMITASLVATRARGLVALVGVFATWGALFAIFMGPQIIRMDLRQDLAHLELLKSWPLRGATVLRGEIVWSAVLVTAITWAFGLLAMTLSMVSLSRIPAPNRAAAWTSLLIVTPAIVLAQYTMHNGIALLFPGWVPLGNSRPRGVDAVGQRLIMLMANWLGLIVALLPGIAVTAALSVFLRPIVGPWVMPLGALFTTLSVVGEMVLVTAALGPILERLDLTAVERPD